MKKSVIIMIFGIFIPFCTSAQLGKVMSKYHGKSGVTVTQLDKSLYGLYQREKLPTETLEILQKLDEVNILNLNTEGCDEGSAKKLISQFQEELESPGKYKLVKSRSHANDKQLIYAQNKNGKISDLVVWNENPERIDIVELRGNIQLDKLATLSRAMNLQGLNSLAAFSSEDTDVPHNNQTKIMRQAIDALEGMYGQHSSNFNHILENFFGEARDSIRMGTTPPYPLYSPEVMEEKLENLSNKLFKELGDEYNLISTHVETTEENGKVKIKINSKNTDVVYVIDGKKASKGEIRMPEKVINVTSMPSNDLKKSYIFITSGKSLGKFTNFKDGILTFSYDNQTYKYNLTKANKPLLVVNGRPTSSFQIDPPHILQIRPISQIEKEMGYYPNAEVIINTK